MEKLNVQQSYRPVTGVEITFWNQNHGNYIPLWHAKVHKIDVCEICLRHLTSENRDSPNQTHPGGNLVDYHGEFSTPRADMTTVKIHVNSVISDIISRYMYMDAKYFYLNKHMDRAEYIMIHTSMIPEEFMTAYNLKDKVNNGYIFERFTKGVYCLLQAWWTTHDSLVQHLEPYGYHPTKTTPVIWKHDSCHHQFHPGRWLFWREILWEITRPAPQGSTRG